MEDIIDASMFQTKYSVPSSHLLFAVYSIRNCTTTPNVRLTHIFLSQASQVTYIHSILGVGAPPFSMSCFYSSSSISIF